MKRLVVAFALTGCSSLLGLTEPTQEGDGGVTPDTGDGPPGPLPGTVRVTMGGTGQQGVVTSDPPGISCPGTCEFTFPVGTEVTLSATAAAANEVFTGFFQGGCTGAQSCTITPEGQVEVFARYFNQLNIWFTSSTVQKPGAFDNIAAADALCDQLAANAGLIERVYRAWLPTTSQTALARMRALSQGPQANLWLRPDGKVFVGSDAQLTQGQIRFPSRLDEFGRDVGDDAIVVTDTLNTGAAGAGTHCQDWASESAAAVLAGEAAGGTNRWTAASTVGCDADAHLYCMSAIANSAFADPPLGGSTVFVTFPTIAANAGLAAMDTLCVNEATAAGIPGASNAKALVTPGGGGTVADRFVGISFTPDPVTRPDRVVIAANMAALLAGAPFAAAPNVAADLEYRDDVVWVGAGAFNEFEADCSGWTSTAGFGATRFAATTRGSTFFQQTACSGSAHLLCFAGVIAMAKPTAPQATRR